MFESVSKQDYTLKYRMRNYPTFDRGLLSLIHEYYKNLRLKISVTGVTLVGSNPTTFTNFLTIKY